MKFSRLLLALLALVPVFSAWSASDAEWYLNKTIQAVRYEGLVTVQTSELDGVTRPFLGKKFTEELFQELQGALYNLDYFEGLIVPSAIKANEAGSEVILLFKVKEKPTIQDIDFLGNSKMNANELQNQVSSKKGEILLMSKVKADEKTLLNAYLEKGFLDIVISSKVENTADHRVKILFTVKEGIQTAVSKIEFKGNAFVSSQALKDSMSTKEQGLFNPGLFKEADFAKDQRTIENYYWNRGYVDAKIVNVERNVVLDKAGDRNVLNIVISIDEGQQYNFDGFSFVGNQIFSNDELQAKVRQTKDKTISKEKVDADYQRIVDLYLENGYIFNQINKKEIRDGQKIRYEIQIVERPRAHIENMVIKGNSRTKERVITREIPLEVGDVFSKTKIMNGLRNLYNLQYFTTVSPETSQGSAEGLMDLAMNVEEGKTADVSFGVTFSGSGDFPLSAQVGWSDKNFLGNGQTFGVQSTLSPTEQSVNLNFTDNWFMDQRLTVGGTLGLTHQVVKNVSQDISPPNYDSSKSVPDPYDANDYVFSRDTYYKGVLYKAGQSFPGTPTTADISNYSLETRYDYDYGNGQLLSGNPMQYDLWKVSLGVNTGYTWYTWLGRLGVGTGVGTTVKDVVYDPTVYRPANKMIRENLNSWLFNNKWWVKGTWDTRDLVYNPTNGFDLSQTITLVGGILGGASHYTRFDSKAEGYLKLLEFNFFDVYDYMLVFKLRTALSVIGNPVGNPGTKVIQSDDQLIIDGMTNGRGWSYTKYGLQTWCSGAELRMPVVKDMLWWDFFLDQTAMVSSGDSSDSVLYSNLANVPLKAYHFSWGFGLRIVNPSFPLALYVAKPFYYDESGNLTWASGGGMFGSADMKLVVAFGMDM